MSKSRRNFRRSRKYSNLFNKMKKTSKNMIPVVKSTLKVVGTTVKNVAVESEPVIKKGLAKVYNFMETGVKYTSNAFKKTRRRTHKKSIKNRKNKKSI